MNKNLKKLTCGALAAVSLLGCASFAGCQTSHPTVEMQISFNGVTYTLDYKLYRKTAPATVKHFLYLAGNGYYDGLCVHDYADDRMYAGEYSASEGGELSHVNYFEKIASFDNFAKFPSSVWEDGEKNTPTYTLKGEFKDNNFEVESGALKETFGSLSMYYYELDDAMAEKKVYCASASEEGKTNKGLYQHNLTTSTFFLSTKTTASTNDEYCTFATLDADSKGELEDLLDAIEEYIEDYYADDEEEFTHTLTKYVFEYDSILKDYRTTKDFEVPCEPIVIKKVKVTKY